MLHTNKCNLMFALTGTGREPFIHAKQTAVQWLANWPGRSFMRSPSAPYGLFVLNMMRF
ncbi:hypothetical protein [Olivibacter sitiensis]|uniref:hypothetical protein n=1 Tax=Olivibacter sitiensis TaxID=376470 RepID=UPI00146FBE3A|nr:hypothetical protein [Olivibacter sitiensis]